MPLRLTPENDDLDDDLDELLPERLLSGFELEALVRTLKRQQDTAVKEMDNAGYARLYEVQERWAATHLKNDNTITVIDDAFSLELAMRDPEVKTILIPRGHDMDTEVMMRFCRKAPKYKSIFIDKSK
jgi:hypothetical protein